MPLQRFRDSFTLIFSFVIIIIIIIIINQDTDMACDLQVAFYFGSYTRTVDVKAICKSGAARVPCPMESAPLVRDRFTVRLKVRFGRICILTHCPSTVHRCVIL